MKRFEIRAEIARPFFVGNSCMRCQLPSSPYRIVAKDATRHATEQKETLFIDDGIEARGRGCFRVLGDGLLASRFKISGRGCILDAIQSSRPSLDPASPKLQACEDAAIQG
jgi:hypothetical protein